MTSAATVELRALAEDLTKAGDSVERTAAELIASVAAQVQANAAARAPRKTGKLASSITVVWEDRLTAVISPTMHYGVFVEFGTGSRGEFPTGSYQIKPKKPGSVLVFKVGDKTVFARSVTHPGIKAQPFMRPAALDALGPFADRLAKEGALAITQGPGSKR